MDIKKELTWANGMTLIRVVLSPFIVLLILRNKPLFAGILLTLALLTDTFDGYLARKFHQETLLGKRFDQLADKTILFLVIFALLLRNGSLFWQITYLSVLAFCVFWGWFIVRKRLYVTLFNRVVMYVQSLLLLAMVFGYLNDWTLAFFAFLFLLSAAEYGWRAFYRRNI